MLSGFVPWLIYNSIQYFTGKVHEKYHTMVNTVYQAEPQSIQGAVLQIPYRRSYGGV